MLILTLLFAGAGVLLLATALPLMRRRIPPNAWYGLRVPATFADEAVWYEANARTGRDLFVLGCVEVIAAVGLRWVPGITEDAYAATNAVILGGGTLVAAAAGWTRANRLLRRGRDG